MYTVFIFAFFLLFLSFNFVKSSGTSVVAINLPEQHKMNGMHVAGNGPVFIRSKCSNYGLEVPYIYLEE
jgi:hypothetical protein